MVSLEQGDTKRVSEINIAQFRGISSEIKWKLCDASQAQSDVLSYIVVGKERVWKISII